MLARRILHNLKMPRPHSTRKVRHGLSRVSGIFQDVPHLQCAPTCHHCPVSRCFSCHYSCLPFPAPACSRCLQAPWRQACRGRFLRPGRLRRGCFLRRVHPDRPRCRLTVRRQKKSRCLHMRMYPGLHLCPWTRPGHGPAPYMSLCPVPCRCQEPRVRGHPAGHSRELRLQWGCPGDGQRMVMS